MKNLALLALAACGSNAPHAGGSIRDGILVIDRFSAQAGHLMVRDASHPLPPAGAAIDLDTPPFITQSLGPSGKPVRYYNFDVQPELPATLYRLVRGGTPAGDVVLVVPGDPGYSDFWQISTVEVPAGVTAEAISNAAQLAGYPHTETGEAIDCPIVPPGTTAKEGAPEALALRYRGLAVTCLRFGAPLPLAAGKVPTSPIYVTFGSEGFVTERGTVQTHNVVFSLPGDLDYSPLWDVHIYEAASFDEVHDAATAEAAPLAKHGPLVNCPIVYVE